MAEPRETFNSETEDRGRSLYFFANQLPEYNQETSGDAVLDIAAARAEGHPLPLDPDLAVEKTLEALGLELHPSPIPRVSEYIRSRLQRAGEGFPGFNYGCFVRTPQQVAFAKMRYGPKNTEKRLVGNELVTVRVGGLEREAAILAALYQHGYQVPMVLGYAPPFPKDAEPDKAESLETLYIEAIPPDEGTTLPPEYWTPQLAKITARQLKTFAKSSAEVELFKDEARQLPVEVLIARAKIPDGDVYHEALAAALNTYPHIDMPIVVHCDTWMNNIVVRHDGSDVLFIDWELAGAGYKGQDAGRTLWGLTLNSDWEFTGITDAARGFIEEWCQSKEDVENLRFGVLFESLRWIADRQDKLLDERLEETEQAALIEQIGAVKQHALNILAHMPIIEDLDAALPHMRLSAIRTILHLTAAPYLSEIGEHGPSNAANTLESHQDVPGLNLYNEFYPRDGHVVALFLEEKHPALMRATVMASLPYTGIRQNLRSPDRLQDEQEVGKIPHEVRDNNSPRAQRRALESDRLYPYYGAIDTTGKNVNAIARICLKNTPESLDFLAERYVGLDGREYSVEDALRLHVNWLRGRMNLNPEGLVESLWINPKHHANQSWADSPDAFHHADGSWAKHHPDKNWGVASVEVQAEVYDALLGAAEVYKAQLQQPVNGTQEQYLQAEIDDLTKRAAQLRRTVLDTFWVEDPVLYGGYVARGTDRDEHGNLRPLALRSSDMGHLLFSKILDGESDEIRMKREAVIRNLFSPEMLSINGIRTLSSDSVRYREDAYHNGSSWPWVTYYTALGFEKHGYHGLSYELKKRVWSLYDETRTLAEYGTGSPDPAHRINVTRQITVFDPSLSAHPIRGFSRYNLVQPPQQAQAWTAAAILAMKYEQAKRNSAHGTSIPTAALDLEKRSFEQEILSRVAEERY